MIVRVIVESAACYKFKKYAGSAMELPRLRADEPVNDTSRSPEIGTGCWRPARRTVVLRAWQDLFLGWCFSWQAESLGHKTFYLGPMLRAGLNLQTPLNRVGPILHD